MAKPISDPIILKLRTSKLKSSEEIAEIIHKTRQVIQPKIAEIIRNIEKGDSGNLVSVRIKGSIEDLSNALCLSLILDDIGGTPDHNLRNRYLEKIQTVCHILGVDFRDVAYFSKHLVQFLNYFE